jgi:ribonuclease P protein component
MLPKEYRLTKRKDFENIFKNGKFFYNKYVTVKYLKNELDLPRLAFVVSNKISKKAVERNKIKRRLRAIFYSGLKDVRPGFDYVLIVKLTIKDLKFGEMRDDLINLFKTKGFGWFK